MSENEIKGVLDDLLYGVTIVKDNKLVYVNNTLKDIFGATEEEIREGTMSKFIAPEEKERMERIIHEIETSASSPQVLEYWILKKDGTKRFLRDNFFELKDNSKIVGKITFTQDITDEIQVESKMLASEMKKSRFLDYLNEHIIFHDTNLKMIWANKAASDSVNLTPEQLVGKSCYEVWHESDTPCTDCPVIKAKETGEAHEAELTTPDKRVWYVRGYPVYGENDELIGMAELTQEITEKKAAEKKLKESEKNYRQLFHNANDMIAVIELFGEGSEDIIGNFIEINNIALEESGYSREEALSMHPKEVIEDLTDELIIDYYDEVMEKQFIIFERNLLTKSGKKIPIEVKATFVTIKGELSVLVTARDLSERKEAAEKLKESEEKYKQLLEISPDAIVASDINGEITFANQQAALMYGTPNLDELIGRNTFEFIAQDDVIRAQRGFQNILTDGFVRNKQFKIIREDGNLLYVETNATVTYDSKGKPSGFIAVTRDISEHKKAEKTILESEEKFRQIFNNANDAIFLTNLSEDYTNDFIEINDVACKTLGYTKEEFLKLKTIHIIAPEAREVQPELMKALKINGYITYETIYLTKEGKTSPVEVNSHIFKLREEEVVLSIARDITVRKQMEKDYLESEERYRKLIETSPDSIILTDLKGNITLANQKAASMYGVENAEDLIALNMMDFTSHEDRKRVFESLGRVFTDAKFETLEYTMLTKDGSRYPAELSASVVVDKNGKPIALMVVSRNIAERKKAEKTIRDSEEKFRQIFNNANDAIFIHKLTKEGKLGEFIEVNNVASEWTGYTRDELLELTPTDIDRPELVNQTIDIGKELKSSGFATFEGVIAHKDGMVKAVEFSSHLFLLYDEVVILSVARDITDRKKAREELIESEEKFRQIFHNANDGIFLTRIVREDKTSPFIEVNEVTCNWLGYSKEELLKMRSVEITAPEEKEYNAEIIKEIYNKGHGTFETVLISKDQRRIPIELSSHLFTLKDEKVVLSIARDITERKKAESAIQESEERYRKLVETSPDGIVVADISGDIIMTNLQGAKYYGTDDVNEIIGLNAFDLIDAGDHALAAANLEKTLEEGKVGPVEYTFLRKNGETYPAELSASVLVDEEEKPFAFVATVRDITERKKVEAQILESEEKYRQLFHNAQDIIAVVDVPRDGSVGNIIDVNDVTCSKTNYLRDEIIGLDIREIVKGLTAEEITSYFKEMLDVDFITFERDFVKKNKETFPVEIQAAPFTLRDEVSVLITARDITERKRDEELKKRAYAQIEQNIDNFDILVDRIRNPLTSIIGYSELADSMHSEIIIEEARKIEEIAQQMSDSWVDSEEFREILRKHMLDNAEKVEE